MSCAQLQCSTVLFCWISTTTKTWRVIDISYCSHAYKVTRINNNLDKNLDNLASAYEEVSDLGMVDVSFYFSFPR